MIHPDNKPINFNYSKANESELQNQKKSSPILPTFPTSESVPTLEFLKKQIKKGHPSKQKIRLADHTSSLGLTNERKELQSKWKGTEIYDLTPRAAKASLMGENTRYEKNCIFSWSENSSTKLLLTIRSNRDFYLEDSKQYTVEITEEGQLTFEGKNYNAPEDIVAHLNNSDSKHKIFKPESHSIKGKYLNGTTPFLMNENCFQTVDVMLANRDFLSVEKLINRYLHTQNNFDLKQRFLSNALSSIAKAYQMEPSNQIVHLLDHLIRNQEAFKYLNLFNLEEPLEVIVNINNESLTNLAFNKLFEKTYVAHSKMVSTQEVITAPTISDPKTIHDMCEIFKSVKCNAFGNADNLLKAAEIFPDTHKHLSLLFQQIPADRKPISLDFSTPVALPPEKKTLSGSEALKKASTMNEAEVIQALNAWKELKVDPEMIIEALAEASQNFDHNNKTHGLSEDYRKIVHRLFAVLQEMPLESLQDKKTRDKLEALFTKYNFSKMWTHSIELSKIESIVAMHPSEMKNIAYQLIAGYYLPQNKLNKINLLINKAPELAEKFWTICLFNGPVEYPRPAWNALVKTTLLHIKEKTFLQDILTDLYRLGQTNLVHLFVENGLKIPEEMVPDFFALAVSSNEPGLLLPIVQQHKDYRFPDGKSLMHMAVEANSPSFVNFLKQNKVALNSTDNEENTPLQNALKSNRLSTALQLDDVNAYKMFADQALSKEPSELKIHLFEIFLNSNSTHVLSLISLMEERLRDFGGKEKISVLNEMKDFIQTRGALFARPPRLVNQQRMHKIYGSAYPNYTAQQMGFAEKRYENYLRVLQGLKSEKWSLEKVYRELATGRNLEKSSELRMDTWNDYAGTIVEGGELSDHYRPFEKIMMNTVKIHLNDPQHRGVDTFAALDQATYQISNATGNTQTNGVLLLLCRPEATIMGVSSYDTITWSHPQREALKNNFADLSKQFEKIINMPSEIGKEESSQELKDAIIRFYWSAVQTMPTFRGNSQYVLELHHMLYEYHGFSTGPVSQEFVFPDCVALSMTFEEFKDKYYDRLFESLPKPIR